MSESIPTKSNGKLPVLNRKDFVSDQEVRWCPGCGDYAILKGVQSMMPDIGVARENIVWISGIGCSSRFPYYMNTYGMHGIHGRAPALASGLKVSRPELSVWVATGDGDGLSIGGNHLLHVLRRNIDINILLFNNRIYGLTKGQYSPTSELGKRAKSTPMGSVDRPLKPLSIALGADATFVARAIDVDVKPMQAMLRRAAQHNGGSFIEILQNCSVFNDGTFADVTDKKQKAERQLVLEHGQPLLFGLNKEYGIRMSADFTPEVVEVGDGEGKVPVSEILVHNERSANPAYAFMLSQLDYPEFPVPVGILRAIDAPVYEQLAHQQIADAKQKHGAGDLEQLLHSGMTWNVTPGTDSTH